jgi:hypothetical protein
MEGLMDKRGRKKGVEEKEELTVAFCKSRPHGREAPVVLASHHLPACLEGVPEVVGIVVVVVSGSSSSRGRGRGGGAVIRRVPAGGSFGLVDAALEVPNLLVLAVV